MKKRMVFWGATHSPFPFVFENPKLWNPKQKSFAFCWSFWEHEESQKKYARKKTLSLLTLSLSLFRGKTRRRVSKDDVVWVRAKRGGDFEAATKDFFFRVVVPREREPEIEYLVSFFFFFSWNLHFLYLYLE